MGTGAAATRTPFPNSIIPASRLTQTGLSVANLYPLPNMPGSPQIGAYNWSVTSTNKVSQSQFSIREDQIISDRQRLFVRFSRMYRDDDKPGTVSGRRRRLTTVGTPSIP